MFKNPFFQDKPSQNEVKDIFPSNCKHTNVWSNCIETTVEGFIGDEGHRSNFISVANSSWQVQKWTTHCWMDPRKNQKIIFFQYIYTFLFIRNQFIRNLRWPICDIFRNAFCFIKICDIFRNIFFIYLILPLSLVSLSLFYIF